MRRPVPALLLFATFAAGCRGTHDRAEESRKNLRSWAATLRLAAEQEGRLSRTFRRDLERSARRHVDGELRNLRKLASRDGSGEAAALASLAERLERAVPAIGGDASPSDGAAAPFRAVERDLEGPPQ